MDKHDRLRLAIRKKIAFLEGALNINVAIGTHQEKTEAHLAFLSKTSEDGFMEESIEFNTQKDMYIFLDRVELLIRMARAQQRGE